MLQRYHASEHAQVRQAAPAMLPDAQDWRSPATDDLFDTILALPDRTEAERFFRDLCTLRELHDMAQRWQVVRLLGEARHYGEVSRLTGASTATVTRIAAWLHHGTGGYRSALERGRRPHRGAPASRGSGRAGARAGTER
ncbi:MAG: YerC/YecD family TrpR-related protein [Chloroflexota bacterium]|nr:YerC/YecD family TrpR-related protein [Chloroflexota bacterium]